MTCKQCGAQIDEDVSLCPSCGAELNASEAAETETAEAETAEAEMAGIETAEGETEGTEEPEAEAEGAEAEEELQRSEEELDGFTDDGEAGFPDGGGSPAKTHRKGFWPFIVSLVVVVGLFVGAAFYFGWTDVIFGGGDDTGAIMKAFDKFNTALQAGDIEAIRSCYLPDTFADGEIPFLSLLIGPTADFKSYVDQGAFGDVSIDFTDDSTTLKSFLTAFQWSFILRGKDDVIMGDDKKSATVLVDQTYYMKGQRQKGYMPFDMVLQDGVWYISKPASAS